MIDSAILGTLLDLNDPGLAAIVELVKPYLPALKRGDKGTVSEYCTALLSRDWTRIDRAMYEGMTDDERDQLSQAVYQDARHSVEQAYQLRRRFKDDVANVLLALLTAAI